MGPAVRRRRRRAARRAAARRPAARRRRRAAARRPAARVRRAAAADARRRRRRWTDASLPPGWEEIQQADGSVYFFNVDTGASSWDRPGAGVDVKADLGMAE